MNEKFIKLVEDNRDRFKCILEDTILVYKDYLDGMNRGVMSAIDKEICKSIEADIEFVRDLRNSLL